MGRLVLTTMTKAKGIARARGILTTMAKPMLTTVAKARGVAGGIILATMAKPTVIADSRGHLDNHVQTQWG